MKFTLKNGLPVHIRPFEEPDFAEIQQLNHKEGWDNLVGRGEDTKAAWQNSNIAFVAVTNGEIMGCIRGLTDQQITLYICELIIKEEFRGLKIGQKLLYFVHHLYPKTRMELLASSESHTFYEYLQFRPFYGYRKTIEEY